MLGIMLEEEEGGGGKKKQDANGPHSHTNTHFHSQTNTQTLSLRGVTLYAGVKYLSCLIWLCADTHTHTHTNILKHAAFWCLISTNEGLIRHVHLVSPQI